MNRKILYLLISWSTLIVACKQIAPSSNTSTPSADEGQATEVTNAIDSTTESADNEVLGVLSTERAKNIIEEQAHTVLELIAEKKFDELTNYLHPEKGVRFSPYPYVEVEEDRVYAKEDLQTAWADTSVHQWGFEDGIGDPILQDFKTYYNQYIYNKDFLGAKKIGYNTIIGKGNTINNRRAVYPNAIIVEYHDLGSEQYGGMDWGSLSLVFEKTDTKWLLVGIIHSQWTI